jgi:CubicO group peptidase (beta-lactamase class C family)
MKRSVILAAAGLAAAAAGLGLWRAGHMARVASAYKAKALCSEVFLAGRDAKSVESVEFEGISPVIDRARARLDRVNRRVDASVMGLGRARASYREGYGCTIESGTPAPLPALAPVADKALPEALATSPLILRRVDYADLEAALDRAFADAAAGHRAILAVVDGRLVAERYADGFRPETPMLSWSMAKSLTATLVGAAALKGWLRVEDPAPVPEWAGDADRARITWNDLLRMQSGLAFDETYGDPGSDVSDSLFRAREAGAAAARKRMVAAPGEVWSYSSGTTNLVMRTLRGVLKERGTDVAEFARAEVFGAIGAASFVMEPDSSGAPIGSSYVYATARDWAKLGLLYLDAGVAGGRRVLPEGWTDYVKTPTAKSDGEYGAHFWLNRGGAARGRAVPGLGEDMYYMAGHEGQYVFVIPSKNAVVVRLGMTRARRPIDIAGAAAAEIAKAISDLPLADPAQR